MKTPPLFVLHIYCIISIFVALFVQYRIHFSLPMFEWVSSYLKDFLVIPIVATFCLQCVWRLKKDKNIRLNKFTILTLVLIYSYLFEFYFPKRIEYYISDPWDGFYYFLGGIVFYFLQKIENKNQRLFGINLVGK